MIFCSRPGFGAPFSHALFRRLARAGEGDGVKDVLPRLVHHKEARLPVVFAADRPS